MTRDFCDLADSDRLARQVAFLVEVDKLKQVFRQSYLVDQQRKENDAEHSWHFAMMVAVLAEYAGEDIDLLRVIKMALVHDLVEIDAGDVVVYDAAARAAQTQKEQAAADRLFGLLPDDQRDELRSLWNEFEARQTPEARFAKAVDRLGPILLNYCTQGRTWREHGIRPQQVLDTNGHIGEGAPEIWTLVQRIVTDARQRGYFDTPEADHA